MVIRVILLFLAGAALAADLHAGPPAPRTDALGDLLPEGAIARLGTLRFKHTPSGDPTIDVAFFAPDGKTAVSLVHSRSAVFLWDVGSGKPVEGPWSLQNHGGASAVVYSPDGMVLAIGGNFADGGANGKKVVAGNGITLYDIRLAKAVKTLATQPPSALAFADEGKTLVAAGNGKVSWFDIGAGKETGSWTPFGEEKKVFKEGQIKAKTFHAALSRDGKCLAVQTLWAEENANGPRPGRGEEESVEQEATGYDLATRKVVWHTVWNGQPDGGQCRFAFSPDGKTIALAKGARKVELRGTATGKLLMDPLDHKNQGDNFLGGLALSSDGGICAVASGESNVFLWNTRDKSAPRRLVARIAQYWSASTQCLDFSPDDKTLLVGVDADIQFYDVATLADLRPCDGHRGWVDFVAFARDGQQLLTGSADINMHPQELAAWDTTSWKLLQLTSVRTPPWPKFAFASPDQKVFVGKNGDDAFALFAQKDGQLLARLRVPSKKPPQTRGFFSPSGTYYSLPSKDDRDRDIQRLYAVPSGKLVCQLPPLVQTAAGRAMDSTQPIAFSADDRLVALYRINDAVIQVIEIATGKMLHALGEKWNSDAPGGNNQFHGNLAFSPDAKYLASWKVMESVVRIWDLASGQELMQVATEEKSPPAQRFQPNQPDLTRRVHFAWSPDGRTLAVGEHKIRLCELATLGVRRELAGHKDGLIRALAYSPSGHLLASGSADTTVLIWDTSSHASGGDVVLESGDLEKRWQALAEDDAVKAYAAVRELIATPAASIALMKGRLKSASPVDDKQVEELIEQLSASQYKVRQKATLDLLQLGERVLPLLDKALASHPALEAQLRLTEVRKRVFGVVLKGERLQTFRAVEVLEHIGTPEARAILHTLAGGAHGALLTAQAENALRRLEQNPAAKSTQQVN